LQITSGGEENEEFKEALPSGNTGEIEGWRESYIVPLLSSPLQIPIWSKAVSSAQRNFVGTSPPQTSPKFLAVYLAVNWSMPHKILQVHSGAQPRAHFPVQPTAAKDESSAVQSQSGA
jgi:hypothetical protein